VTTDTQALVLVFLLLFLPLIFFFSARVRRGHEVSLRCISAFEALPNLIGRAAETGQALHVGLGSGSVVGQDTASALAGLTVLGYLADQAAVFDCPPVVTVADMALLPVAQDVLRNGYLRQNRLRGYRSTAVRFLGPAPAVYAAGVMDVLAHEGIAANTMIGEMGDEYLLIGETGAQRDLNQIVGTSNVGALPFVFCTADETLIGEEMFAGGAYLSRLPEHIGCLLAQDWMRVLLVGVILAGVLWYTVF
jgi:hypothetical protein